MVNAKRNINILSTPGVYLEESMIALETMKSIVEIGHGNNDIINVHFWQEPDYWHRKNPESIDIDAFYIKQKKSLEESYDFILTEKPLSAIGMNSIRGYAIPEKACIVSLGQLRNIANNSDREECERQLVYHEGGHLFGMPHRKSGDLDFDTGKHCTNGCAMREILSIRDLQKFAKERKILGSAYCKPCKEGLVEYFKA